MTKQPASLDREVDPTDALTDDRCPTDTEADRLSNHRRRQESVAAVLDALFGKPAQCKPRLWERKAYLMLVGLIYERLATNEKEISTDDLVSLAKVLADHRKVAPARAFRRTAARRPQSRTRDTQLPESFGEIVKQVYGTSVGTTKS